MEVEGTEMSYKHRYEEGEGSKSSPMKKYIVYLKFRLLLHIRVTNGYLFVTTLS